MWSLTGEVVNFAATSRYLNSWDYETSIGSVAISITKGVVKAVVLTGALVVGIAETVMLAACAAFAKIVIAFDPDSAKSFTDIRVHFALSVTALISIFSTTLGAEAAIQFSDELFPDRIKVVKNLFVFLSIAFVCEIGQKIASSISSSTKILRDKCEIEKNTSSCQMLKSYWMSLAVASIIVASIYLSTRVKEEESDEASSY